MKGRDGPVPSRHLPRETPASPPCPPAARSLPRPRAPPRAWAYPHPTAPRPRSPPKPCGLPRPGAPSALTPRPPLPPPTPLPLPPAPAHDRDPNPDPAAAACPRCLPGVPRAKHPTSGSALPSAILRVARPCRRVQAGPPRAGEGAGVTGPLGGVSVVCSGTSGTS